MYDTLKKVIFEEEARKNMAENQKLREERFDKAEKAFVEAELEVDVVDDEGWETDGNMLLKTFYYEDESDSARQRTISATFVVNFKENNNLIKSTHVNW